MTHDPHVNYASDWQTPPEWVEWARATMGGIDLDPCAAREGWFAEANYTGEEGAKRVGHESGDGLAMPWHGRVYVNPPGSNSIRSVKAWWAKAMRELARIESTNDPNVTYRPVHALTWCFFNCEAPRALSPSPFDLPGYLVIPNRRVAFWRDGKPIKQPRNWTWFWTTERPAPPPVASWVVATGPGAIEEYVSKPNGQNGEKTDGSSSEEAA